MSMNATMVNYFIIVIFMRHASTLQGLTHACATMGMVETGFNAEVSFQSAAFMRITNPYVPCAVIYSF